MHYRNIKVVRCSFDGWRLTDLFIVHFFYLLNDLQGNTGVSYRKINLSP